MATNTEAVLAALGRIRSSAKRLSQRRIWKKVALHVKCVRAFLVDIGAIAGVAGLSTIVVLAVLRDTIEIEPIQAPKRAVDAGYTPEVLALLLMDHVLRIERQAKDPIVRFERVQRPVGRHAFSLPASQINLEVSGASISVNSLVAYVKKLIGDPDTAIVGQMTDVNNRISLYLKIRGTVVPVSSEGVDLSKLDDVLDQGAREIIKAYEPYTLAAYLYQTDPASALAIAETMLPKGQITEDAVRVYNLRGIFFSDTNQYDDAVKNFQAAIKLDRTDPTAYINLANTYLQLGNPTDALLQFGSAIQQNPKVPAAYIGRGIAEYNMGLHGAALETFQTALNLDRENPTIYIYLGVVLNGERRYTEAIANFRKAIEIDPTMVSAYSYLGDSLQQNDKLDEAIAVYRMAINVDPKDATIYSDLGDALQQKGRSGEAIAAYRKAIESDPEGKSTSGTNLGSIQARLGHALKQNGQLDEAIAVYREVVGLNDKFWRIYADLGDALIEKGQIDEAIATYRKAVDVDREDSRSQTTLNALLFQKRHGL